MDHWIKLGIQTTQQGLEVIAGALDALGINQIEMEQEDSGIEGDLQEIAQYWDFADAKALSGKQGARVIVYLGDNEEGHAQMDSISTRMQELKEMDLGVDIGTLTMTKEIIRQEDWVNAYKEFYKPIFLGKNLLIRPLWETVEDTQGRVVLTMDPGLVFGTGSHETTRMCLELIERTVTNGMKVLDVGCGSGILGILTLLLGAERAELVDIDPQAKSSVDDNMRENGIDQSHYHLEIGDVLNDAELFEGLVKKGPYDLVLANIVAGVVIPLTEKLKPFLRKGTKYIASGIINDRLEEVKQAIQDAGFTLDEVLTLGEWNALLCTF